MFRSKVMLIVQNTINKNFYNSGRASIWALYSSNTSNINLTETGTETLNKNVSEASTETLNKNVSEASTEILTEALTKTSNQESTNSVTEQTVNSVDTSDGTSSATSTQESRPDKLYLNIIVEIRGHDPKVLLSYIDFSTMAAKYLNIQIGAVIREGKPHHDRFTTLKSVHVHKKHRVQYETRTYYRYFQLDYLTGSTADTYLEYIQRNLPEGVAMKVTKTELHTLPESVRQASSQ